MADDTMQVWGYSKDGAQLFDLKPGEKLPEGTFDSPASVPGSEAQKVLYRRRGARGRADAAGYRGAACGSRQGGQGGQGSRQGRHGHQGR
jgi:hypothetical protein